MITSHAKNSPPSLVQNSLKFLPPSFSFHVGMLFILLLWEFVHDRIYNLLSQTKAVVVIFACLLSSCIRAFG